ncbi:MAG: DUF4271 domain-containing protein [Alistipes sp.]
MAGTVGYTSQFGIAQSTPITPHATQRVATPHWSVAAWSADSRQTATVDSLRVDSLKIDLPSVDSPSVDSLRVDSLAAHAASVDYSNAYPFAVYGTADSLRPWRQNTYPLALEARAEQVFGTESQITTLQLPRESAAQSLTDNAVFQGFVLLLAALYAVLLYTNLDDLRNLFGRVVHNPNKRIFEDSSSGFLRFLNITTAIGVLFAGVSMVKFGDSLLPTYLLKMLPYGVVVALSLIVSLACVLLILYQILALRITGAILLTQPFVSQLILLKRIYFSLAVVLVSPFLLLFALCPRGMGDVWGTIIVLELILILLLFFVATLNLFLSKKVSISHWFLYLCTVEAFPISFLWLLAIR